MFAIYNKKIIISVKVLYRFLMFNFNDRIQLSRKCPRLNIRPASEIILKPKLLNRELKYLPENLFDNFANFCHNC